MTGFLEDEFCIQFHVLCVFRVPGISKNVPTYVQYCVDICISPTLVHTVGHNFGHAFGHHFVYVQPLVPTVVSDARADRRAQFRARVRSRRSRSRRCRRRRRRSRPDAAQIGRRRVAATHGIVVVSRGAAMRRRCGRSGGRPAIRPRAGHLRGML